MKQALVITELLREIPHHTGPFYRVFQATGMHDHFPTPLSWRSFKLGASDYDITADEAYCPCGATVRPPDDAADIVLGDFVDAAEAHIETEHPGARRA